MRLVLDANEYLYALGADRKESCQELVHGLMERRDQDVRIVRTIVEEVLRNSPSWAHKRLFEALGLILEEDCDIDEDFVIPYHRGEHFREVGFKQADAMIAAYAEAVGADILVSENRRHFHAFAEELPFHVMDATAFLKHHVRWPSPPSSPSSPPAGTSRPSIGAAAFLLQDYHNQEMQDNLMMAADVEDLDAWWKRIQEVLPRHPGACAKEPTDYPWGRREVHLVDPARVCWHFAQESRLA